MLVVFAVGLGLFLIMAGAIVAKLGDQKFVNQTNEQTIANDNLKNVWGPILINAGMFFFVSGLVFAAIALAELDPLVRLFLLIVAFVALLLILVRSPTVFG